MLKRPQEPVRVTTGRFDESLWMYADEVGTMSEMGRKYERDRADFYAAALTSIAMNTCCDRCQEAALVARAALGKNDE